jgi:hypothetical protein
MASATLRERDRATLLLDVADVRHYSPILCIQRIVFIEVILLTIGDDKH